jgi:hypothetical protein
MRRPKYTLEPLVELRERRAEEATKELAGAVAQREQAERVRAAAEMRRASLDAQARAVREVEARALSLGELHVADLARADAWELRVASERAKRDEAVSRAREGEARARESETEARGRAAARQADAEVVKKDRARWDEAERKRGEAREEEAVSDGTSAALPPRGPHLAGAYTRWRRKG